MNLVRDVHWRWTTAENWCWEIEVSNWRHLVEASNVNQWFQIFPEEIDLPPSPPKKLSTRWMPRSIIVWSDSVFFLAILKQYTNVGGTRDFSPWQTVPEKLVNRFVKTWYILSFHSKLLTVTKMTLVYLHNNIYKFFLLVLFSHYSTSDCDDTSSS